MSELGFLGLEDGLGLGGAMIRMGDILAEKPWPDTLVPKLIRGIPVNQARRDEYGQ